MSPHVSTLVAAARRSSTAGKRVLWLHKAATAWSQSLADVAACRRGCAHCCHIAVTMTDVEAREIGQRIGRPPAIVAGAPSTQEMLEHPEVRVPGGPGSEAGYDAPCPFLKAHECSIYEHRPMACRTQLNMDVDALLCELRPGGPIPVPYANATQLKSLYVLAQPAARWADVRAFFPRPAAQL